MTYDPNGNILTYNRKGAPEIGKPADMDALTYNYEANTNRLNYVHDDITSTYTEDIESQNSNNYTYDFSGNLRTDIKEGITDITWTVYGKIASITKNGNLIAYTYDAAGNRITKTAGGDTTVYIRDAKGNVMSIYQKRSQGDLVQTEVQLNGTGRIGMVDSLTVPAVTVPLVAAYGTATVSTFTRNEKIFELSNHLGNVVATIGDKRIQNSSNNASIDYYTADVFTASDYFPFGMLMPGRNYTATNTYRYGFNGKENDNLIRT